MSNSCGPNFSEIQLYLLELLPKNPKTWAQLGHEAKKTGVSER